MPYLSMYLTKNDTWLERVRRNSQTNHRRPYSGPRLQRRKAMARIADKIKPTAMLKKVTEIKFLSYKFKVNIFN